MARMRKTCAVLIPLAGMSLPAHAQGAAGAIAGFGVVVVLGLILAGVTFYVLPSLIARSRGVADQTKIVILNIFLGWTFVGWLGALIWSLTAESALQAQMRKMVTAHIAPSAPPATLFEPPVDASPSSSLSAGRKLGAIVGRVSGKRSD